MTLRKISKIFIIAFLAISVISCASNKIEVPESKAVVTKEAERMFWKISGTDKKGKPSFVYLQGTVHLADSRMLPVHENVMKVFNNADRIYAELSTEDLANIKIESVRLLKNSFRKDKKDVCSSLSEEQLDILYKLIDPRIVKIYRYFDPWVLESLLEERLYQDCSLKREFGLDFYFFEEAKKQGKNVGGLDNMQDQLDLLHYGEYEIQLEKFKDALDAFKDKEKLISLLSSMYEAYISDDPEGMKKIIEDDDKEDEIKHEFYVELHKKMLDDRNESWAKQITSFLDAGGTTFIYVGSAHLIQGNTVFHFLREQGTIE